MKDENNKKNETEEPKSDLPQCGIVMPISAIDGCSMDHWKEVKTIITEAVAAAGYRASLVSESDDAGVIQRTIVQNLYDNEIVVCDVSCKNPNVMFELGMRLAFDKPTIVVIDDKTNYSFDTSVIEHLSYPRDLRYSRILEFKRNLAEKIKGTVKASKEKGYKSFLKNFGEFHVAEIEQKEGSAEQVILSRLQELTEMVVLVNNRVKNNEKQIIVYDEFKNRNILYNEVYSALKSYCDKNNLYFPELISECNLHKEKLLNYVIANTSLKKTNGSITFIYEIIKDVIGSMKN